jgi:carbamoyltransferase
MTRILGLSAYYHDSAACLIEDGRIIAAAQEERFTRKKHDSAFPTHAIDYCLKTAGISADQLDYVAFYEKTFVKFERLLETYMAYAPFGIASFIKAMPQWIKRKLWIKDLIETELNFKGKIIFPDHHESHAASAFFPSPFQEAAILTADGVGEWATASYGVGQNNHFKLLAEIRFPHSLGLLYSAFTYYCGFRVNSGEYKLMGLAPYGEPKYKDLILNNLIDIKEDGSFRLNMKYFDYGAGLKMTSRHFHDLFGAPPRPPESKLTQRDMDIARSIQEVTEEVMLKMARHIHRVTGSENLCLAGGVALNCVANGRILREGPFKNIWIQPAAGDAGSALGAALFVWYQHLEKERTADGKRDSMQGSYLGPSFSDSEIRSFLKEKDIPYTELKEGDVAAKIAELLGNEKVIGWFQGRMEFGPRALGGRSIIGDARSPKMQEVMNLKIKFRESFRPFAPSVLREKVGQFFEMNCDSPYMLLVAPVRKDLRKNMTADQEKMFGLEKINQIRSTIPAVTHVD